MTTTVDIVLPCLDEAEALPAVLAAIPAGYRVLVVDNGSTDDTAAVASACGATVVSEPRRGYGAAMHTGLLAATAELVGVLDADGSLPPHALPQLVMEVMGGTDLAVGRRRPHAGAWPWHARAGNTVLAALLRRQGLPVHDIAPIRVARRQALLNLGITDRGFGYPFELLLRAAAAGWRVREFDVEYRPRAGGRSKVSGSVRGTARAARDMTAAMRRVSQADAPDSPARSH
ncbi:MAG TPA: glycosyltransferase family 2 protein [Pseudonocardiaceae bacterium]